MYKTNYELSPEVNNKTVILQFFFGIHIKM